MMLLRTEKNPAKRLAYMGIFLALSMIFSYVESMIPFYFGVPGMKIGLPNIVIVTVLTLFGPIPALLVNLVRVFLTGLLFTTFYSVLFSIAGAVFSFAAMLVVKKVFRASVIPTSVAGGVFHNVGQVLAAAIAVKTYQVTFYLPVLLVAGFITGMINGIVANIIIGRLRKVSF